MVDQPPREPQQEFSRFALGPKISPSPRNDNSNDLHAIGEFAFQSITKVEWLIRQLQYGRLSQQSCFKRQARAPVWDMNGTIFGRAGYQVIVFTHALPSDPLQFVVIAIVGWMNHPQRQVVEYLLEENRVLREQINSRRMRSNDDQSRRLAVKAKSLGRKLLARVATIVTPENFVGLAPNANRRGIRWQRVPYAGTTGNRGRS
jgi:hypothetical protein